MKCFIGLEKGNSSPPLVPAIIQHDFVTFSLLR